MYITKDKVFLHMVKSAGISVHVGLIQSKQTINFNQRHLGVNLIPDKYKKLPRYGIIRSPEDWYKSFYNFFIRTQGYMSFMLNDPKDGFIYPISFDEFIKRSVNLKNTLITYPNKARVFNNILRSQGNIHFICGYFDSSIDIDNNNNFGDLKTLNQFDMSLYEWFYRGCGMHTSYNTPMSELQDIEKLFNIKIGHENKTKNQEKLNYTKKSLKLIQTSHKKFYDEIKNYKGI